MPEPIIIFDHVSKKFARGEQHTTLRDLIPALVKNWWNKKQIDEQALKAEEFWAVNDVSACLYIKGRSLEFLAAGKAVPEDAQVAYKAASALSYGRCWDPEQKTFWNPPQEAAGRLKRPK